MKLVRIGDRIINLETIVEVDLDSKAGQLVLVTTAPGPIDPDDIKSNDPYGGPHLLIFDGEEADHLWEYLAARADLVSMAYGD